MLKSKVQRMAASCGLVVGVLAGVMVLAPSSAGAAGSPVLYNSIVSPLPGNVVSQSFEATETSEFGNAINIGPSSGPLSNVVVTMSSWGCQTGHWTNDTCATAPGSTFSTPITLNLYSLGANGAVGSLIGTDTQTFAIPYRPSADNVHCTGAQSGEWYDAAEAACHNGLAVNITFDFSGQHLALPSSLIYGIQYNTSDYGPNPYGDGTACHATTAGCGYDSLNVGLSSDGTAVTAGSDAFPGKLYENTKYAPYYCDNGAAGTGIFRLDSPNQDPNNCTSPSAGWALNENNGIGTAPYYVPAVQFNLPSATKLVTQPAVLELLPGLSLLAGPTATLSSGNVPLGGQTLTFTTPSGGLLCTATTNAVGVATCGSGQALASLLALGYTASFAGNGSYSPTAAAGSLIVLLGFVIL
ncbi:MAG TPA: hypothetical protein VG412_08080 [Acidimicrobiales bacterium]|nr:hypothetical protein [Acidimicrobiales bacterium]